MRKITFCYFFFIFFQNHNLNAQTFRNMFDKLEATISEGYSFYSNLDGGIYNYESARMDAYLNMYEATKDIKYLNLFAIHSKRVMDRRDDFIGNAYPVNINPANASINCTGNSWIPTWVPIYETCSMTGNISLVPPILITNAKPVWSRPKCDEDCNLKPYPPFMESGVITFPMARFVLMMKSSNIINEHLPNEVSSSMNGSNYGNNVVTTYGEYADWLKARVYETINWEVNNDLVASPFKHFESYWSVGSGGGWKGINQQCAIGRTMILMYYIGYLDGYINNYYRDIIEDIAYALYEDIHYSSVSLQYSTSSYYVWCHAYDCSFNSIFEDISHASLDQEFAELYINYFNPVSGYGRFNISDMQKFANGESELVIPKPLETKMNVLGTNSSCDQMCNGDSIHYQYVCLAYIF